jgi:hypothetical protein
MPEKLAAVSPWPIVRDNAKMVAMYTLGTVLVAGVWWPGGVIYLGYCAFSLWLFIRLICPYCKRYHAASCRSGYHVLARFYPPADTAQFTRRFKRHVVWLYPVWFVPPVAAAYRLIIAFSWWTIVLLVAFGLVSFVLLPYVSHQYSCKTCENIENCPIRLGRSRRNE